MPTKAYTNAKKKTKQRGKVNNEILINAWDKWKLDARQCLRNKAGQNCVAQIFELIQTGNSFLNNSLMSDYWQPTTTIIASMKIKQTELETQRVNDANKKNGKTGTNRSDRSGSHYQELKF